MGYRLHMAGSDKSFSAEDLRQYAEALGLEEVVQRIDALNKYGIRYSNEDFDILSWARRELAKEASRVLSD